MVDMSIRAPSQKKTGDKGLSLENSYRMYGIADIQEHENEEIAKEKTKLNM